MITRRRYGVPITPNPAARRFAGRDHSSLLLAKVASRSWSQRSRGEETRTLARGRPAQSSRTTRPTHRAFAARRRLGQTASVSWRFLSQVPDAVSSAMRPGAPYCIGRPARGAGCVRAPLHYGRPRGCPYSARLLSNSLAALSLRGSRLAASPLRPSVRRRAAHFGSARLGAVRRCSLTRARVSRRTRRRCFASSRDGPQAPPGAARRVAGVPRVR